MPGGEIARASVEIVHQLHTSHVGTCACSIPAQAAKPPKELLDILWLTQGSLIAPSRFTAGRGKLRRV